MNRGALLTLNLFALLAVGCDPAGDAEGCVDPEGTGARDAPLASLSAGDGASFSVCSDAADWVAVPASGVVRVTADARVEVSLVDGREVLAEETGSTVALSLGGVRPVLSIRALDGLVAYTVEVDPRPERCAETTVLVLGAQLVTVCAAGTLATVPAAIDAEVEITVTAADAPLTATLTVGRWHQVRALTPGTAGRLAHGFGRAGTLHLSGPEASSAQVLVRATAWLDVVEDVVPVPLQGIDRAVTADGLGSPVPGPLAGAWVLASRAADRLPLAAGATDADGALTLRVRAEAGTPLELELSARVLLEDAEVSVGPEPDAVWQTSLGSRVAGAPSEVLAPDEADPIHPALHIAQVAASGLARLNEVVEGAALPVRIIWSPERASACGTCYRPGPPPRIELSGKISDPDEWDDAVVGHEIAHVVTDTLCRDDSPGGAHGDPPTAPPIAWSEGWATFVAAWLAGDSVLRDYRAVGVRSVDIATLDDGLLGTSDQTATGDVSERLVATLLWRLNQDFGEAVLFEVVFERLAGVADLGARGIDLVDFLDALACLVDEERLREQVDALAFPHAPACR